MKLRGRVVRSDLEGGLWLFETEEGGSYQLKGGGADLLVDGVEATVEGRLDTGGVGIGMVGDILVVSRYTIHGR